MHPIINNPIAYPLHPRFIEDHLMSLTTHISTHKSKACSSTLNLLCIELMTANSQLTTAFTAATCTICTAVATAGRSAAFAPFQCFQPSQPPDKNVNSAASPVLPARQFSDRRQSCGRELYALRPLGVTTATGFQKCLVSSTANTTASNICKAVRLRMT